MDIDLIDLRPLNVLIEYDGPRVFICKDKYGGLLLAYNCEEEESRNIFIAAVFSEELLGKLTNGHITILEALDQPRAWLISVANDWQVQGVSSIKRDDIPPSLLPDPGVMLWPRLQPLLSLRAIGANIGEESLLASVVKETVERAEGTWKVLLEYAGTAVGMAESAIRDLYDLRTQRMAFGSFEIAFGKPKPRPETEGTPEQVERLYEKVSEMLRTGMSISEQASFDLPGDKQAKEAILQAAVNLSPTGRSAIEEIQVSGLLIGRPNSDPVKLNKKTHKEASRALSGMRLIEHKKPVLFYGQIRAAFDSEPLRFTLNKTEDNAAITFELKEEHRNLWHDVLVAMEDHSPVAVSGIKDLRSARFNAIAVHPSPEGREE